jgi:O-antigen/teichoic acid export membrane protein
VSQPIQNTAVLGAPPGEDTLTIARNLSTRYLALGVEMVVGMLVLPINVAYLGAAAYGLWMLTSTVTMYFSMVGFGFSYGMVKFVARYRAERNPQALNEILSSAFFVLAGLAVVTYVSAMIAATFLGSLFQLTPAQVRLGQILLLVTSVHVAVGMTFGVFGGVINGFQRYDLNNIVGTVISLVTAAVNVAVLVAGYGLVELVVATTIVRVLAYWLYRANAYRVFPGLAIRAANFRLARLKEITPFGLHMLVIDGAHRINHSIDVIVIGVFLNTTAVAVWAVAQRLADAIHRVSIQLSDVLFPTVVDNDTAQRADRLQSIFVLGTRLSLAMVIPIGGTLILTATPLVDAWVGTAFSESALILQVLAFTMIVRVGAATAGTVLKGCGEHRMVAVTNVVIAAVNLSLSLALVGTLGLLGIAIGTLIPVSLGCAVVLFPAGCRRVNLPLTRAWREAIWPALWPAVVMAAFVVVTRPLVPASLLAVAAHMGASALIYALTFTTCAISAVERRIFISRFMQLSLRRRVPPAVPVASEGA